jgi:hypothetical protein
VKKTDYREKIRLIAEEREVLHLLHFTQFSNLREIVKHGILSRNRLAGAEYMAHASDRFRLDGNGEAISVSISRVNERMFAAKRHRSGHADWVLLVLPAEILWTHECRFSWRNAAKKETKDHRGWRGGPWAFNQMFVGSQEARKCYTTDPEAEVQVLEPIAPNCILGALVYRPEMVEKVQAESDRLPGAKRMVVFDKDTGEL